MRGSQAVVIAILIAIPFTHTEGSSAKRGFGPTHWGMSPSEVHPVLTGIYGPPEYDSVGIRRYADTLYGSSCEIIPGFEQDSLRAVLVRFHASNYRDGAAAFASVRVELSEERGAADLERDFASYMPEIHGESSRIARWIADGSKLILLLDRNERLHTQLDLLFTYVTPADTMAVGATEERKDKEKRDWKTEQVQKALSLLAMFCRQLNPPYVFKSTHDSTRDSVECDPSFTGEREVPPRTWKTLNFKGPEYPEAAELRGIEGTVWVKVLIGSNGKVVDACIAKPADDDVGFEESAIRTAYRMRYEPYYRCGEPEEIWVTYPVHFKLDR